MQYLKASTLRPLMSALGQKQTFAPQKAMSALPPKADMCSNSVCPLWANSGLMHRSKLLFIRSPRRREKSALVEH